MKKVSAARNHKSGKKLSLPPELPAFDALESMAASDVPSVAGAWWITHQVTEHIFSSIGKIDSRTGAPLSKPLTEILDSIRRATVTGCRPFPHDRLVTVAQFAVKSLEKLLDRYRHRVIRVHEQLPFHQIREVDARSMAWLTRQPGRNVREKLSGRTHALGVKRSVTADTTENRLLQSFAKLFTQRANERLEFTNVYDFTAGDVDRARCISECMVLCNERMQRTELADVPTVTKLQPNNVLLSDPLYSRVFRAWKWLREDEESLLETWTTTLDRSRTLLSWMVAAHLATQSRVVVTESVGRIHAGHGEGHLFGVELLGTNDGHAEWQLNPELHFLVHPTGSKDPAFQICLSVEGEYIMAHMVTLAGQGALHEESTFAFAFEVKAAPERLLFNRGIGLVVEGLETASRGAENGCADIAGLSVFAEQIALQILNRCRLNFTKEKNKQFNSYAEKNTARLGIEFGNTSILVSAERRVPVSTAPWAIALELPNEVNSFEWLDGLVERQVINGAAARSLWTSGDLFEADEPIHAGMIALSAARVLGCLKDELHTTTDTRIAYAVPDFIDAFSQRSLRSAFAGSFHQPVPVWRSVAAAIAWSSLKSARLRPGESVLVVDSEFMKVTLTVLTARPDDKLKSLHTSSNGMYWERKPPLPPDEDMEIPGWPLVLREYAHWIVELALPSVPKDQIERIADDLLRTGTISNLVQNGGSALIQIPSNSGGAPTIVELFEDCDWFNSYVGKWINGIVNGINAAWKTVTINHVLLTGGPFGYERFQQTKSNIGRIEQFHHDKGFGWIEANKSRQRIFVHVSSVQRGSQLNEGDFVSFNVGEGRKGAEAKDVETISPLTHWLADRITISSSLIALGARECLLRLDTECITWREWLPELSLELIRDGHYGELQLLERGIFIDPFLGKDEKFTIPERLMLTSGERWFSFPLLIGRQDRRPIAWEARLESPAFPLNRDIEVKIEMTYRYGLENSYELSVVPVVTANAPFERIFAKWMRGNVSANASSSNGPLTFQSPPWIQEDSERFVSATQSLARIDDDKFGKFLFAITRDCWSQGRSIASAPLNVQQVFPHFRDHLFHIVSQSLIQTAHQVPRALEILVLLHVDAPTKLIEILLRLDDEAVDDVMSSRKILTLMDKLVGDGCGERVVVLKRLLDHLNRHTNPVTFNPALASMSIRAIGNAAWRNPGFIASLAAESGAVRLIISQCQRSLNNLLRKVPAEIVTAEKRIEVERRDGTLFRDTCELLLALLRVDQSNPEVALLKFGSSTADALAKVIRQLDARFVAIDIDIRWRVQINADVDKALHRMSSIAFTLNRYLAEGAGSNLVHIRGIDED
jgi:cold shock CspA family protein